MQISYKTNGVCARKVFVEVEDGIVKDVKFEGSCNGNTKGVATLAIGLKADDVIEKLQHIKCGFKNTSCPAQLAEALKQAKGE